MCKRCGKPGAEWGIRKPLPTNPRRDWPLKPLIPVFQSLQLIIDHTTTTVIPNVLYICFVLFETVSFSPGRPGTHSAKNSLRLVILSLPPKCCDYKPHHPSCFMQCWGLRTMLPGHARLTLCDWTTSLAP